MMKKEDIIRARDIKARILEEKCEICSDIEYEQDNGYDQTEL